MADEAQLPFFEFDLGDFGHSFRFKTAAELSEWCDKEIHFWEWVPQVNAGRPLRGIYDHLARGPKQIKSIAQSVGESNALRQQLESAFQQSYCQEKAIHSSHPKALAIEKLREVDPAAAVAMLAVSTGFFADKQRQSSAEFNLGEFSSVVRGVVENAFFADGLKGISEGQEKALSELRQEFKDQIRHQAELLSSFDALVAASKATSEAAITEQSKRFEILHESSTKQFAELFTSAKADLEAYIESVKKRWALSESVSYWDTKEKYHKKRAFWFGIAWPTLGIGLAYGIFELTWWLSGGLKPLQAAQGAVVQPLPSITQPNYWHIAVLVISVTLSIWFLRILVRVFLSHLHRHADAHERITLIKTYLALLQEGKELVPDDRKIIIQTIFRPSPSGLVKEDAAPASPWEFLSRKP